MPEKKKTFWEYLEEAGIRIAINIDKAIELGEFELAEVDV